MKNQILFKRLAFLLFGMWLVSYFSIVYAEDCAIADPAKAADWKACEGKTVKVKGTRATMDDVPPAYSEADPSLSGGKGFQDYMTFDDETYVIVRTSTSVDCPDEMEAQGTLKYHDLKGEKEKVRIIEDSKVTCK